MTANAIFYGKEPGGLDEALLRGVLSSLITIPTTVIFIFFFRNIRRRELKRKQKVEREAWTWRSIIAQRSSTRIGVEEQARDPLADESDREWE
eukprot:1305287-Rhodomonas_salina.1